jgi:hypothetical protein
MAGRKQDPAYRDLDIYRLVVARMWKRKHVADSFGLSHSRLAQIIRRVRQWVDQRVGDWLFPGCPDLRFYAALDKQQIRLWVADDNPQHVVIEHASGRKRYTRTAIVTLDGAAPVVCGSPDPALAPTEGLNGTDPSPDSPKLAPSMNAKPLNNFSPADFSAVDPTPIPPTTSARISPDITPDQLLKLFAQWKKAQKFSAAKQPPLSSAGVSP